MPLTELASQPISTATRSTLPPTPVAETELPPSHSVGMKAWVYHPLGAWLVEQNTLPSQLLTKQLSKKVSLHTGYRTLTLLLTTPELGSDELDRSAMVGVEANWG